MENMCTRKFVVTAAKDNVAASDGLVQLMHKLTSGLMISIVMTNRSPYTESYMLVSSSYRMYGILY